MPNEIANNSEEIYKMERNLKELNASQVKWIDKKINEMTLEQKVLQVMCWRVTGRTLDEINRILEKYPVGAIFLGPEVFTVEESQKISSTVSGKTDIPVIVNADLVNGAGARVVGCTQFPWQMACGATNSEKLLEEMGKATAIEGRNAGIHWTLAPVVDLNINPFNAMMGIRTFGQDPEHVLRMAKAFIRGVQKDGLMAATAKHFPGDGVDDRDSHICTSVNNLSLDKWMDLYGKIWKGVIESGVMTIMSGHIALPCVDSGNGSYLGSPPATASNLIQQDFLRGKLGFEGLIVSDALPMSGYCMHIPSKERVWRNIQAGSDMVLWAEPERDYQWTIEAVMNNNLSEERLNDAVRRVLELKARVGLLGNDIPLPEVRPQDRIEFQQCADEIAEKSISIARDATGILPLKLSNEAKVLTVSCEFDETLRGIVQNLDIVDDELIKRGFQVDHLKNPDPEELNQVCHDYDAVFVNLHIVPRYGTIRLYGRTGSIFWDSFWHDHFCVVFTSFGDPYKIYELPSLPNMVNVYSNTPSSQRAAVKVWLGEIPAQGQCPIKLEGFFDIEV